MQNLNQLKAKWRVFIFPLTTLLVFALDQLTKTLIRANLAVNQSMFELGFFRITHVHNTGAAFGMFPDQSMLLVIIAITGITIVLFLIIFFPHRYPFLRTGISQLALGLMLGGNVGNLVDRLRFGGVTDFISIGIWPAFNIADPAIFIGAVLFAYVLLRLSLAPKSSTSA